jgi:hypothetical protein
VPAKVPDRGGVTLPDFDQSGGNDALERLADRRARHAQHLGEPTFAGQGFARLHLATENLGEDLLEDVLRDRTSVDRLQRHAISMTERRKEVKWSDQCHLLRV